MGHLLVSPLRLPEFISALMIMSTIRTLIAVIPAAIIAYLIFEFSILSLGLTGDDIIDVFNVFMNVDLHPDGTFTIKPSEVGIDDFIEMRAEMDILAAVSACPADTSPTNGGKSQPLGIQIFDA